MRHLSLETDSSTTTREIHVVNNLQASSEGVRRPAPASFTKRRLYSRARRDGHRHRSEGGLRVGDHKGKHPLSSPQTKRFARLMGSSSALSRSTAGSSSLNQVVVELLAQEIFQNNVGTTSQTSTLPEASGSSTIVETSMRRMTRARSSKEASTSGGSFRRPPRVRHDNASFEVMWSINEQENPLMGLPSSFHNRDSSSETMEVDSMDDSTERFPDSLQFSSDPNSDCDDEPHGEKRGGSHSRSRSLKRSLTKSSDNLQTRPSKRHSFRNSMARLSKRYGSVSIRQSSFRRAEKVHASEPEFEIFDF